jgi:hypothetical protein
MHLLNHIILIDLSIKFENNPALIYPFIRYYRHRELMFEAFAVLSGFPFFPLFYARLHNPVHGLSSWNLCRDAPVYRSV